MASSRIRIRGLRQKRAGDGDALALATGQLDAALADDRLVAVAKALDELIAVGQAGGSLDLFE